MDIDPGRLLGLTDGIFGMVMTLLIFGMALPEMELLSSGDFYNFLVNSIPTIGLTLVSFVLLASFWIYHHEFIKINNPANKVTISGNIYATQEPETEDI